MTYFCLQHKYAFEGSAGVYIFGGSCFSSGTTTITPRSKRLKSWNSLSSLSCLHTSDTESQPRDSLDENVCVNKQIKQLEKLRGVRHKTSSYLRLPLLSFLRSEQRPHRKPPAQSECRQLQRPVSLPAWFFIVDHTHTLTHIYKHTHKQSVDLQHMCICPFIRARHEALQKLSTFFYSPKPVEPAAR